MLHSCRINLLKNKQKKKNLHNMDLYKVKYDGENDETFMGISIVDDPQWFWFYCF